MWRGSWKPKSSRNPARALMRLRDLLRTRQLTRLRPDRETSRERTRARMRILLRSSGRHPTTRGPGSAAAADRQSDEVILAAPTLG